MVTYHLNTMAIYNELKMSNLITFQGPTIDPEYLTLRAKI